MAQRGIREYDGKRLLAKYWEDYLGEIEPYHGKIALVEPQTKINSLAEEAPWLKKEKLTVKPDQLFGKRGKNNLVLLDANFNQAKKWIEERRGKEIALNEVKGKLTHFLVEPFAPHEENEEYYIAITSNREGDKIYFSSQGGVDIEEMWDKVKEVQVPILREVEDKEIKEKLDKLEGGKFTSFLQGLFKFYEELGFAYLELNPLVMKEDKFIPLDLVARMDDTAHFWCKKKWGNLEFPAPLGRKISPEEKTVKRMDEKSGASMKLTLLNPGGRVWTMIAGGGASVVYTDTIVDLGWGKEVANYGEYSGNPTTDETYQYAKIILEVMTRKPHPRGKFLLIGGGIANFTNVAKTFEGIIKALKEYKEKLKENKVKIYVRRGGPNYKEGLENMRKLGEEIKVPTQVFGPEAHMTSIVSKALKEKH